MFAIIFYDFFFSGVALERSDSQLMHINMLATVYGHFEWLYDVHMCCG